MKEKIITVIQNIRSKSKQRVTLHRIFRFINKGTLVSNVNSSKIAWIN